jgi:alkylhydroperoxidase family enzyme
VVRQRGQVPPSDVEALRAAGYTDEEIVEAIAAIAVNIFTNYFNNIVGTEIDFPIVRSASAR